MDRSHQNIHILVSEQAGFSRVAVGAIPATMSPWTARLMASLEGMRIVVGAPCVVVFTTASLGPCRLM